MTRFFLATVITLVSGSRSQAPHQDARTDTADHTIWLRSAAPQWDHAMPLGNGRLGAMVFGTVNRERIQLNEDTLWMGGPRETDNPEALRTRCPRCAGCCSPGKPARGVRARRSKLMGKPWRSSRTRRSAICGSTSITKARSPTTAASSISTRPSPASAIASTASATRARSSPAIPIRSSSSASPPTGRARCRSAPGSIARRTRAREIVGTRSTRSRSARLRAARAWRSSARRKIIAEGGHAETFPERIVVERANAVTIVVARGTSFQRRATRARRSVERDLAARGRKPYAQLLADHVADHQRLFRRVALRLGRPVRPRAAALPTDERLERVKRGRPTRRSTRSTSSSAAIC